MNFKQRLSRYLVGIFIGVLLSFVLFGQRNCTGWMPENRVKATILELPVRSTAYVDCLQECYDVNDSTLIELMKYGAVDFSESATRATPKMYVMNFAEPVEGSLQVELRDTASVVIELTVEGKGCDCDALKP